MGFFLVYILKSAFCLTLFYLFYRLLLSKETFHRFNRFTLLGILSLSLFLPLIEINSSGSGRVHQAVMSVEQALSSSPEVVQSVTDAGLASAAEAENLPAAYPTGGLSAKPVYATDGREYEESVSTETSFTWVEAVMLVYLSGVLLLLLYSICSLLRMVMLLRSGSFHRQEDGMVLVVHDREVPPFSWLKYVVVSRRDLEEGGREILLHEKAHYSHCHSLDLLFVDICVFFQWFNPFAWLLKRDLRAIHEYEADASVLASGVDSRDYQLLLIKKSVGTRLYAMASSFKEYKLKNRIHMMLKRKSNPWARLKCLYMLPLAGIVLMAFARPEVGEKAESVKSSLPVDTVWLKDAEGGKYLSLRGDATNRLPLIIIDGKEMDKNVLNALLDTHIKAVDIYQPAEAAEKFGKLGRHGAVVVELYTKEEVDEISRNKYSAYRDEADEDMEYMKKYCALQGKTLTVGNQYSEEDIYIVNRRKATVKIAKALNAFWVKSRFPKYEFDTYVDNGKELKAEGEIMAITLHTEKYRRTLGEKMTSGSAWDYFEYELQNRFKEKNINEVVYTLNGKQVEEEVMKAQLDTIPYKALFQSTIVGGSNPIRVTVMTRDFYKTMMVHVIGTVKDEAGNPMPYVNVSPKGLGQGTFTSKEGTFSTSAFKDGFISFVDVAGKKADLELKVAPNMEVVMKDK